jgi:hypothetical protein
VTPLSFTEDAQLARAGHAEELGGPEAELSRIAPPRALSPLDHLRRAERTLRRAGGESELFVANGIRKYLDGEKLAPALGLALAAGEHDQRKLDRRDQALRRAAAFVDGPRYAVAEAVAVRLARYAATAWLNDRLHGRCPKRHRGTITEHLFEALLAHPRCISADQVARRILSSGYAGGFHSDEASPPSLKITNRGD